MTKILKSLLSVVINLWRLVILFCFGCINVVLAMLIVFICWVGVIFYTALSFIETDMNPHDSFYVRILEFLNQRLGGKE